MPPPPEPPKPSDRGRGREPTRATPPSSRPHRSEPVEYGPPSFTEKGCIAIFGVILILALLWLALLYLGVPVGIIGCCVAAYWFKSNANRVDALDDAKAKIARRDAVIIAGASTALIIASLVGNYFNKDGPLHSWMRGRSDPAINQDGEP